MSAFEMRRLNMGLDCTHLSDEAFWQAVKLFASQVMSEHGTPDILVNNAGTIKRKPAAEHSDEMWIDIGFRRVIHVAGSIFCAKPRG